MTVRCVHLRRHSFVFTFDESKKNSNSYFIFRPLYWYPNVYQRSARSNLIPSYYESAELPNLYTNALEEAAAEDEDDSGLNNVPG